MAGVMMTADSGMTVGEQSVPTMAGSAKVVAGGHVDTDNLRANGVAYPETFGIAVDTSAYPEGTRMVDHTPGDHVN